MKKSIRLFLFGFIPCLSNLAVSAQVSFNMDAGKFRSTKDTTRKQTPQRFTLPDGKIITEEKLDSIGKAWGGFNMRRDISKNPPEIFLIPRTAQDDIDRTTKEKAFISNLVGTQAPDFTLRDVTNRLVKLSNLRGKVVVLNFWFTECKPCIQEMPALNQLAKNFPSAKVSFLALALNNKQTLKEFLKKQPFDYQILQDAKPETKSYGVYSWPTHIVVDGKGKITFVQLGGENITEALTKAIQANLN